MRVPSRFLKLSLIALSGWLTACAPTTMGPQTPWIVFHRSGGIAGFDETWSIFANGRVEHRGSGVGRSVFLRDDQVRELSKVVRAANFEALADSYVPEESCCDRFFYEITVMLDGRSKTVNTLDAAPDEPPALTRLREQLSRSLQPPTP